MEGEHLILEYYVNQRKNLAHYLRLCVERTEAESVHKLRVSIKKLRMVYKLAGILMPEAEQEDKQELVRIKKLFRLAGRIRDAQVAMELIAENGSRSGENYRELTDYLRDTELRSVKRFYRDVHLLSEHPFTIRSSVLFAEKLKSLPKELVSGRSLFLEQKLLKRITKLAAGDPDENGLHRIRILMKQYRYLVNVLARDGDAGPRKSHSPEKMESAEMLLGKWHDHLVALAFVRDFIKENKKEELPEPKKYNALIEILEEKCSALLSEIKPVLEECFMPI